MKRFYITLIALVLVSVAGMAQTTKTWNGPASGGSWATASNWLPTGAPTNGNIVVFDAGVSGTISAVPNITLGGLRIENGTNITFTVTNDRTINVSTTGGTERFIIDATSSLTLSAGGDDIDFNFNRSGGMGNTTARIDGTFRFGNNCAIDFGNNNTLMTVNGSIENTGGTLTGTTARLQFAAGSTYSHQRNGGAIPSATWNASSTCEVTGVTNTVPTTTSFNQDFGNFTWNCPNQTGPLSLAAQLETINGNFSVISTGTGNIALKASGGGTTTTTVAGDFSISGGNLVFARDANQTDLVVSGNVSISGGTLTKGNGFGNFIFDGSSEQSFSKTGGTVSGAVSFQIWDGASVNFGTSVLDGTTATFSVASGGKIIVESNDGLRSGTTNAGPIQVGGSRFYSSDGIYEFRGARTGDFFTSTGAVRSLIINNTSGEVILDRGIIINTSLVLENGYLTGNAVIGNYLILGNTATSTSNNGAYVNGRIDKNINATTNFTFHVGNPSAGGLRPISISNTTGSGTSQFEAEFKRANPNTAVGNVLGSGLARVSACEYWTLNRNSGTRQAEVTIGWGPGSNCTSVTQYITNLLTLRVARFDGSSWVDAGANLVGGSTLTEGSISSNAVTSFSPFALASGNQADNPLPVLFDGVRAYGKDGGVHIEWSNLTERDIVRYEVERSADGINYYPINQQAPKSNRDDKASYTHFDAAPINGANFYRIRVDEIGGKPVYSKILRVEMGSTKAASFSLYPNPVVGKQLTVSLNGLRQGQYSLQVFNTSGQRVYSTNINNAGAGVTQMIELPATLKTGMYVTVVSGEGFRESKQFILQ
jgi:hypothetical protein